MEARAPNPLFGGKDGKGCLKLDEGVFIEVESITHSGVFSPSQGTPNSREAIESFPRVG
ncbi:MAG: hypothetical protein ACJA16_003518 [Akkermansiaceae bacterium]|jgi:hypothetical protein